MPLPGCTLHVPQDALPLEDLPLLEDVDLDNVLDSVQSIEDWQRQPAGQQRRCRQPVAGGQPDHDALLRVWNEDIALRYGGRVPDALAGPGACASLPHPRSWSLTGLLRVAPMSWPFDTSCRICVSDIFLARLLAEAMAMARFSKPGGHCRNKGGIGPLDNGNCLTAKAVVAYAAEHMQAEALEQARDPDGRQGPPTYTL